MHAKAFAKEWGELLKAVPEKEWESVHHYMLSKLRSMNKLSELPQIVSLLRGMLWGESDEMPITITSARDLDEKLVKEITKEMTGDKNAVISWIKDPKVLGGVVMETEELRMDASLRGQLKSLEEQMKSIV